MMVPQARNSAVHSMLIAQDPSVLHLTLASDRAAGGLPASCESLGGAACIGNPLVKLLATVKGMDIKLKALLQQQVVVLVLLTSPPLGPWALPP